MGRNDDEFKACKNAFNKVVSEYESLIKDKNNQTDAYLNLLEAMRDEIDSRYRLNLYLKVLRSALENIKTDEDDVEK